MQKNYRVPIVHYRWEKIKPHLNKIRTINDHSAIASGAFVSRYHPDLHELLKHPENTNHVGNPVIFVDEALAMILTSEEHHGIMLHEEAHVMHGDIVEDDKRIARMTGTRRSIRREIKADLYAVRKGVSPSALISGRDKIIDLAISRLYPSNSFATKLLRMFVKKTVQLSAEVRARNKALLNSVVC